MPFIISRKVVSIPAHQLETPFTRWHCYEVYACEMPNAVWPAHRRSEYLLPLAACLQVVGKNTECGKVHPYVTWFLQWRGITV